MLSARLQGDSEPDHSDTCWFGTGSLVTVHATNLERYQIIKPSEVTKISAALSLLAPLSLELLEYPTIQACPTTRVLEEGFNLESG